jgi:hypothetical protein
MARIRLKKKQPYFITFYHPSSVYSATYYFYSVAELRDHFYHYPVKLSFRKIK